MRIIALEEHVLPRDIIEAAGRLYEPTILTAGLAADGRQPTLGDVVDRVGIPSRSTERRRVRRDDSA